MAVYKQFSRKQKQVLYWWNIEEYKNCDAIICDGAVRSGKTLCMSISFILWGMQAFNRAGFAICGKTITSVKRNVISPVIQHIKELGFSVKDYGSKNYFDVTCGNIQNRFYIFGGKDEGSASLIQGITLSGILLDEVALMPRSFVEQSIARCSVTGSKLWFNCNPENPYHWFKKEWIDKAKRKKALYINFKLYDNPSLSKDIIERYHNLYTGAFYERYVLGEWSCVQGTVYPMFNYENHTFSKPPENITRYAVSCDYGTVNPASFGLWGEADGIWYRMKEYYYDSKISGKQKTDEEHYESLEKLCENLQIESIVCDPSATSFIECIRRHNKFSVNPAKNDVLSGIRRVSDAILKEKIKISQSCADSIREFSLYHWDEKGGVDAPIKENDHAMDDIRYFVSAFLNENSDPFFVLSLERN